MKLLGMWTAAAILALMPGPGSAADAPAEKTGLAVGEKAPAFTLKDQAGQEQTLDQLLKGDGPIALVFYRSASW